MSLRIDPKNINPNMTTDAELAVGLATKYDASNPSGFETPTQLNARDVISKDRANHTGSQLASTISDFAANVRGTVLSGLSTASATAVTAGDNILVAIGKLMALISGLQSSKYDASNPNSYETSFQLNSRDTSNKDRTNHTGTQLSSTISDFNTSADARVALHGTNTNNPHAVSKTQIGLANVTNDSQLKRAAGDFATITQKMNPVANDIALLEDSEDSGNKKRYVLSALPIPTATQTSLNNKVETASDLGSGASVFKQKTGTNLELRKILSGTNISVVENSNDITISSSVAPGAIPSGLAKTNTATFTTSSSFSAVSGVTKTITTTFATKLYAISTFSIGKTGGGSADTEFRISLVSPSENGNIVLMRVNGSSDKISGGCQFESSVLAPGTYTVQLEYRSVDGSSQVDFLSGSIFVQSQEGAKGEDGGNTYIGNVDGGTPTSIYGGSLQIIDGGTP